MDGRTRLSHFTDGADELLDTLANAHAGYYADDDVIVRQAEAGLEVRQGQRLETVGIDAARNDDHLLARTTFVAVDEIAHRLGVHHHTVGQRVADLGSHQL